MLLAFDVGNSHIKIGLFERDMLKAQWRIATERRRLADEYGVLLLSLFAAAEVDPKDIRGAAIASVVPPLTVQVRELCQNFFGLDPVVIGPGVPAGLRLRDRPLDELGADRIANCVAARRFIGGPVMVVALGTATVFDLVSAEGDYLGGVIAPGIRTSGDALFASAALLRQVDLVRPPAVIGFNTAHQLQAGLVVGFACLVEGLVRRLWEEIGQQVPVIATGGLAPLIAPDARVIGSVEPHLALHGLREIFLLNRPPLA